MQFDQTGEKRRRPSVPPHPVPEAVMSPLMSLSSALVAFSLTSSLAVAPPGAPSNDERLRIVVELDAAPPSSVVMHAARISGQFYDRDAAEKRVERSQEDFLRELRVLGIDHTVTETPVQVKQGLLWKPNRFGFLINALGLTVSASDVEKIRAIEGVKRVTLEEEHELHLDHSVRYVRASDGPGNK